jgi:cell wall-associated NlpC family hydrolase
MGRWVGHNQSRTYELRSGGPLAGPLSHGATIVAVVHEVLGRRRAFYGAGYDLMIFRPSRGLGAYGLVGFALGLSTDSTHKLGAHWSIGGGMEWRPVEFAALGVEARYRVEDRGPRGFWSGGRSQEGLSWAAGLSVRWPFGGRKRGEEPATSAVRPVPLSAPTVVAGAAAGVVRVAVEAIGTPYRWGGTAENGFDCSGLIQWAYGQHGVRLPRRSLDQAGAGAAVPPAVEALAPGDILLFAAQPGAGVSHVGLYVGEGKFIHSANTGVRLSQLDRQDPQGAYWMARWVGARRVL